MQVHQAEFVPLARTHLLKPEHGCRSTVNSGLPQQIAAGENFEYVEGMFHQALCRSNHGASPANWLFHSVHPGEAASAWIRAISQCIWGNGAIVVADCVLQRTGPRRPPTLP